MFCPKCGQWNAGSATQCTACGTSLLPPGLGSTPSPAAPAPTGPAPQPPLPQMPPLSSQPPSYSSAPPGYPTPAPTQAPYPTYPPQTVPSPQSGPPVYPNYPQQPAPGPQPGAPIYPNYPQPAPSYPPQPYPNPTYGGVPGSTPPAYPSYSPLPNYTPVATGAPYASAPSYGTGYPAQMARAANQCKVCGSLIAYGALSCAICLVPLGMIANPFDPTVTTYLDARALNQPGTSPVYAAPGAYAARAPGSAHSVPVEARGWNWSAALNSTLWAFSHRSFGWGLYCGFGVFLWVIIILGLSAVPKADAGDALVGTFVIGSVVGVFWLIKTLYLGLKGNEIAWRSGRFSNVSQMKNVQRQWVLWSVVVFLVASGVLTAATIIAGKH